MVGHSQRLPKTYDIICMGTHLYHGESLWGQEECPQIYILVKETAFSRHSTEYRTSMGLRRIRNMYIFNKTPKNNQEYLIIF